MNRWRSLLIAPLCGLVLFGQGCLGLGGSSTTSTGADGGVFRSKNNGLSWQQLVTLNAGQKPGSIANVNIFKIAVDPQDPTALYAASDAGLLISLDGGESWSQIKAPELKGTISSIAIHPKDKCAVIVTKSNQLYKTTNCGRDWFQIFYDPQTDKTFTALAIDWFNPNNIYAGTSAGDVYKSVDGGSSWRAIHRENGIAISDIVMHPKDSRIIYFLAAGSGLGKTTNGGVTWELIKKPFQEFENARRVSAIALDPINASTIYLASKYGILKSTDAGATWKPLTLSSAPGTVDIRALIVHPFNSKFLAYATDKTLILSTDGGVSWTPRKLPTSRRPTTLVFDRTQPPVLYLGSAAQK